MDKRKIFLGILCVGSFISLLWSSHWGFAQVPTPDEMRRKMMERRPAPKEPMPPSPEERLERERRAGIESFYAEPSPIDYGNEVTLRWRFKSPTDNPRELTTTLKGIQMSGISIAIGPERWRVVSRSGGIFEPNILEGTYTFRPQWRGNYSDFRLTIRHGDRTYQAETRGRGVQVNCYKLEVKSETIQSPEPKVRFYVENKVWEYSAAYRGRLRLNYRIASSPSGPFNKTGPLNRTGDHDFGLVDLAPGSRTPAFEVPLSPKEVAFASNDISIESTMRWISPYPSEGEQSIRLTSTYSWTQTRGSLARPVALVNLLLGGLKVHVHNNGGQASYVELPGMGRKPFDIPEMRVEVEGLFGEHWGWYRSWIRDINSAYIGLDAISIGEGGIRLNVPVEAGGPTEIRCVYDPLGIGGYTDDTACPDVDLRGPISVKVVFIPVVVDGKIGYSHANVDVTIGDTTFPGAWDWFVELFTGDLKPKIERETEKSLKELLDMAEVKSAFKDAMARLLRETGFNVTRVTRIEVSGSDFIFWYL